MNNFLFFSMNDFFISPSHHEKSISLKIILDNELLSWVLLLATSSFFTIYHKLFHDFIKNHLLQTSLIKIKKEVLPHARICK